MKKLIIALSFFWAFFWAFLFASFSSANAEQTAILAAGCFWCIEKDFENVEGVTFVESGYIGGTNENPTYKNHAEFGHREAVRIKFDENKIDYQKLLKIFWRTANPTDPDGQFCDRGQTYTTAIYALNDQQFQIAEQSKKQAGEDLGQKIVTPILRDTNFTPSEEYHQDYYRKNPIKYRYFRATCKRDRTVKKLWGEQAYWGVKGH